MDGGLSESRLTFQKMCLDDGPLLAALHAQRKQLLAWIAALGNLRPGSLTESYRTRDKPARPSRAYSGRTKHTRKVLTRSSLCK